MIAMLLMAASAATSAAPAKVTAAAPPMSPARRVIEAQLQSPPRPENKNSLSAEEADAIYKRYLASIGQRPERAPETQSGATP